MNKLGKDLTFLDIKEVAEILGKHTRTVRRWIKDDKITAYKIGGKYHFKKEDVDKFIEDSKI